MIVPKMNVDGEDLVAAGKPDEKSTRAARSVCRYCSQSARGKPSDCSDLSFLGFIGQGEGDWGWTPTKNRHQDSRDK